MNPAYGTPSPTPTPTPTLSRPRRDRMIAGVCSGIARRFGWKPNTVRLIAVLSCLLPGPQFLIYLAGWFLMPEDLS